MRTSPSLVKRALVALALSTAAITGTVTSVVPVAEAQTTNPFQRGPDPTTASISAVNGPFATASTSVSNASTPGFGAATIYYPTTTTQGTFGGVAIAPGFTATMSSIAWLGPRLASQGFVVITINTNSTFDQPSSRATQLMAALSYLTNTSSVRTRVDRNRLAVMGHSMGGGGTMEAATENPSLQAAIPLTGWHTTKNFSGNRVPTLVVGAENDTVASVSAHSIPFYVVAPLSTFDPRVESGDKIPIEERPAQEVTEGLGRRTAPPGVGVYNPAFDVTPAELVTGIVTEVGLIEAPDRAKIEDALRRGGRDL